MVCYIWKKEGCWFTKHTQERDRMKKQYLTDCTLTSQAPNFDVYLAKYKGIGHNEYGEGSSTEIETEYL